MNEAKYIWMNGKMLPLERGKNPRPLTPSTTVTEPSRGTKAYKTPKGYAIFRLSDHTKRLIESAKMT